MQAFKLVNAGFVDKVIVFDELPKYLLNGIKTRACDGFPRSWARWLGEIGSTRKTYSTSTEKRGPGDYKFTHKEIGNEPCFYVLEYQDLNSDKEAWRLISEHVKMQCGPEVRLREKIEDMARPLAPNSTSPLDVEPEDVPVIPVPALVEKKEDARELVKEGETIIVQESAPKKRGRPKKIAVEA